MKIEVCRPRKKQQRTTYVDRVAQYLEDRDEEEDSSSDSQTSQD